MPKSPSRTKSQPRRPDAADPARSRAAPPAEALDAANAALAEVSRLRAGGSEDALAGALAEAAIAQAETGSLDEALRLATEAVAIGQAIGEGSTVVRACRAAGEVYGLLGQLVEGARLLGQARRASLDDDGERARVLAALCRNALRQAGRAARPGAPDADDLVADAIEHGREGLAAARRAGDPGAEAVCAASLGEALLAGRQIDAARAALGDARALAATQESRVLQHRIAAVEAEALLAGGHARAGVAALRRLARTCAKTGAPLVEIDVQAALHRGAKSLGDLALALAAHERFHLLDARIRSEAAQSRARVLINAVETQNARLEAEKARLEAELLRLKSRRLESEKRALEAQARELDRHAHQDALTGLWNRRYIDDELPRLVGDAATREAPLTLSVGDIDLFKSINDKYGHPTGDAVLCTVADLLRDNCRPSDTVARVGGEEFLLVLEDTDPTGAYQVCERLRRAVERHAWARIAPELVVTISFGISDPTVGADARELLATADRQLYVAKNSGRNRVEPRRH